MSYELPNTPWRLATTSAAQKIAPQSRFQNHHLERGLFLLVHKSTSRDRIALQAEQRHPHRRYTRSSLEGVCFNHTTIDGHDRGNLYSVRCAFVAAHACMHVSTYTHTHTMSQVPPPTLPIRSQKLQDCDASRSTDATHAQWCRPHNQDE